jgi:hypothetical protein
MISSTPANTDGAGGGNVFEDWLTPGRYAALLGLLIVACFPQVVFGLETFFYRDFALFGFPLASYHRESFWHGEMPLWNPFNDCGLPFTAQWNTLTLYPLSIFYLLFPVSWSLGMFCLGHLFLAGMGMYFLAYRWTGSRLAAAIAGTAFAYNGLSWHALMWPNNSAALGWMPWVVLANERAWREGGRAILLAGLAGAMQMLAGAPEIILQTWFLLGVLWLSQLFTREIPLPKMIGRAVASGLLVGALAAAQLLPFLDLLKYSQRDTTFSDSAWSMPATGLGNYLVSLFHSMHAGRGVYVQHDQYWTSSYYVGIGVVVFALVAIWRNRSRRVWTLALLIAFSLAMALGEHSWFYLGLKKIAPQIGFMRYPIKFVVLATFALPLLAAHGLAWLRNCSAEQWLRERKLLAGLAVLLVVIISTLVYFATQHPLVGDDLNGVVKSGIRGVIFLGLVLGTLLLLRAVKRDQMQWILQSALVVVFWMDVFSHVPTLSPTVKRDVYETGLMRKYRNWESQLQLGQSRAMQTHASLVRMYWGSVQEPVQDVYGRRLTMYDDVNLLDRVPKFDGFYSLYLREMDDIVQRIYVTTNDLPGLRDFLAISHVNPSTNTMEWEVRPTVSPLITGGQQAEFLESKKILDVLFDPAFDGRKTVYLSPETRGLIHATNRAEIKIGPTQFGTSRVRFAVEAASPGMVVISQAWYHSWRAYVDGKEVRLWRANHAFQALEVPVGSHRVELIYKDKSFMAGCTISLLTLLGCVAGWLAGRRTYPA